MAAPDDKRVTRRAKTTLEELVKSIEAEEGVGVDEYED
jgi:hypothetical protein